MKTAVVLSGGGSKGSYELGVWKALRRLHIHYDIVTGTSVGALNGAMMVQKSYRKAKKLWYKLTFNNIFDSNLTKDATEMELLKDYGKSFLKDGGKDVSNLEKMLRKAMNSKRFFATPIDFGLVTYNTTTKKPELIKKQDLTPQNLIPYLIASSSCFPAFQKKTIEGNDYIDGGYYDVLPINLAIDLGAENIIAVDLKAVGIHQKIKDPSIPITYLSPQNQLDSFLYFDKEAALHGSRLGYLETMKTFGKLEGKRFTFRKGQIRKLNEHYAPLVIQAIKQTVSQENSKVLDQILKVALYTRIESHQKKNADLLETVEQLGQIFEVPEEKIYTLRKFNRQLKNRIKKEQMKEFQDVEEQLKLKKIKELLNTKKITVYLYHKIKSQKTDHDRRRLMELSILMPHEFIKALYLSII